MSESKAKPEKPANTGNQGRPPRNFQTLIGHEEKGQQPDRITLIESEVRRRRRTGDNG